MKITIIGLGFVGLTTALGFAHKRHTVYGFDINLKRINELQNGIVPFHEPSLEIFLRKHLNKNFIICESLGEAVKKAHIIFYCVGTPSKADGSVDLRFLKKAIRLSSAFITKDEYKILVVKSTVPPSTTKNVIKPFLEKYGFKVGEEIGLANNPEFLREGFAWEDFTKPDRIIIGIGENDKKCGDALERIFKPFKAPIFRVSLNTSEFIKYLSNTLLSTLISFSNEMSIVADWIGDIDIRKSFKILHLDRRWSGNPAQMTSYVYPGCGFGGYCLPKDTYAVFRISQKRGYNATLLNEVLSVNQRVKKHFIGKIMKSLRNKDGYIGILGLSFKPETDDIRDTPAQDIIKMLLEHGFKKIIAYDPMAMDNFKNACKFPIKYAKTLEELVARCDIIVILTAWQEFKVKRGLYKGKEVIDGRYFLLEEATFKKCLR